MAWPIYTIPLALPSCFLGTIKVVEEEKDIRFQLLNVWVDGNTAIAEWHADFTLTQSNKRISMDEVAILTIRDGLFSSLREYYKATVIKI